MGFTHYSLREQKRIPICFRWLGFMWYIVGAILEGDGALMVSEIKKNGRKEGVWV